MRLPPFQTLLDAHGRDVHRFLIATVGPVDCRRLLPGDVAGGPARLPAAAGRLQPARLAVHDRPPQGDRSRPRPRPPGHAGGRARRAARGGGRAGPGPTAVTAVSDADLWTAVAALPDKQRTAVALRFIADSAYAEIADRDGDHRAGGTAQRPRGPQAPRKEAHADERDQRQPPHPATVTRRWSARCAPRCGAPRTPSRPRRSSTPRRPPGCWTSPTRRLDSPVGTLLLGDHPGRLARLAYLDDGQEDAVLDDDRRPALAADARRPRAGSTSRAASSTSTSPDAGGPFDLALDLRLMTDFTRRVLTATAAIPYGSVSTLPGRGHRRPAAPAAPAPPATRWAPTRCRSCSPATACCTAAAARRLHRRPGAQADAADHRGPSRLSDRSPTGTARI